MQMTPISFARIPRFSLKPRHACYFAASIFLHAGVLGAFAYAAPSELEREELERRDQIVLMQQYLMARAEREIEPGDAKEGGTGVRAKGEAATLGSRYAIDFREDREFEAKLQELVRAIYGQPHPGKPPLGANPFSDQGQTVTQSAVSRNDTRDIADWHQAMHRRFEKLRSERIQRGLDPFEYGFWQASFWISTKGF